MNGFTFNKDYYDAIKKIRKDSERGAVMLAIAEYVFEGNEPQNLSESGEIVFELLRKSLEKSRKNTLNGLQPKRKRNGSETEANCKRNGSEFESRFQNAYEKKEKLSLLENEEKRTKKEDKDNTLVKEKEKERKKEIYINNKNNSAGAYVIDFSAMSDEELLEWGEGNEMDFGDAEALERFSKWEEEMQRRSKRNAKWKPKVVNTEYGIDRLKSHDEIIKSYVSSTALQNLIKDFLRHCYVNKRVTTNDKLIGIITRLDDACGENDALKCEFVERAISGGYFDIKV